MLAPAALVPNSSIALTCPAQPSNANGGMMFDIYAYRDLVLTNFSWITPAAYLPGNSSFAVQVLFRFGSITDGQTVYNATTGVYNGGAKGAVGAFPASLSNWTSLLNASVVGLNMLAPIPGTVSVALPAGTRASLWFLFMDGTKPTRSTDNVTAVNTTTADDGMLAIYRANQPTAINQGARAGDASLG